MCHGGCGEEDWEVKFPVSVFRKNRENTISDDRLDETIANALQQLSVEERENVYYDQHGVSDAIQEEPQFVAQCLEEMQQHLQGQLQSTAIRQTWAEAYLLAEQKDPDYVNNPKLRLRFLRTECFDAKKAAKRFILYFDFKKYLFGETKLCKDITQDDLDKDDMKAMKSGVVQQLPARDRAGRAVCMVFPSHFGSQNPDTIVRSTISSLNIGCFDFVLLCSQSTFSFACYYIISSVYFSMCPSRTNTQIEREK